MIELNGKKVKITRFPDNSFKFDLNETRPFGLNELKWKFESMEELFSIIGIATKLENEKVNLTIPYLPNARMDKICNESEGFMLKYMVETLDNLGFNQIEVLDPHSEVYTKFAKKTKWISSDLLVKHLVDRAISSIKQETGTAEVDLVYPDKGSCSRYSQILKKKSAMFGKKERNQETGEILSFDLVGEVPTNPILIVDDICSRGGTFKFTAKKLREKGYKGEIFIYVTHAEQTIELGSLLHQDSEVSKVFTTDSIFKGQHEKMEIYSI